MGRTTTNILLAIIAAALLFGSAATLGVLAWLAVAAVILVVLAILLVGIRWAVDETGKAFREAPNRNERIMVIIGTAMMCWLPIVFGTALVKWMYGKDQPLGAAIVGWPGIVMLAGMLLGGTIVLLSFLYDKREAIPGAFRKGLRIAAHIPIAPISLLLHEWRYGRSEGWGVLRASSAAAAGFIGGLMVWLIILGIAGGIGLLG